MVIHRVNPRRVIALDSPVRSPVRSASSRTGNAPADPTRRSSSPTSSSRSAHELSCTEEVHLPRPVYDLRQSHPAWSGAPRHVYTEITPGVSSNPMKDMGLRTHAASHESIPGGRGSRAVDGHHPRGRTARRRWIPVRDRARRSLTHRRTTTCSDRAEPSGCVHHARNCLSRSRFPAESSSTDPRNPAISWANERTSSRDRANLKGRHRGPTNQTRIRIRPNTTAAATRR